MKNFIKGFLAGIFNITPGLSGSILLVLLNLYDKCLYEISNIFKTPKQSIKFLLPIGIGIISGIFLFSNIIFLLINNFKQETFIVFTGFILGTIPHLTKKSIKKGFNKKYLIPFFFTLTIGISMSLIKNNNISYFISYDITYIIKYIFLGMILSLGTIIPGISSTILLSIFNLYGIYIISIAKFNILVLLPIAFGFFLMTFMLSKVINYLLKNYYSYVYFGILGFAISTIPTLIDLNVNFNINILISIFLAAISSIITNFYLGYEKR